MPRKTKMTLSTMPKLTLAGYTRLITALALLNKQAKAGTIPDPTIGICGNWAANLGSHDEPANPYSLVLKIAQDWPGSRWPGELASYPVTYTPDVGGLWKGENLHRRLSLIDYLLKRMRSFKQQLQLQQERTSPHR